LQREPKAYLWDAREAVDAIAVFTRGMTREDFQQDLLLRSAVERQFEIVGESLNQLARRDQTLAGQIPDLPHIVAFRNILIHGYAIVDNDRVWRVIQESLPELRKAVDRLLGDDPTEA